MSYFEVRDLKNMQKIGKYLQNLPEYCYDFFTGIENNTSSLTRVNYAMDLSVFFDYLEKYVLKKPKMEITLDDLSSLQSRNIENYLSYLSYYQNEENKMQKNSERGKARKLASVRSFFKYLFNHDMIASNVMEKISEAFLESVESNKINNYIKIYGRVNNSRTYRYIDEKYIISNNFLKNYNVILPESNGAGNFGEVLSSPFICKPNEGASDTFISIGAFMSEFEAESLLKYLKTKFARALLSTKKVTQHNGKETWCNVPQQNFSNKSDIDWNQPIPEIDKQLFKKYNLSEEEIKFIDTNVKPMV